MNKINIGIPGFSKITGGGLSAPSIISFLGSPGTGKTTLAMNIMFDLAKKKKRSLYVTGLTLPAWKIVTNYSEFEFFNPKYTDTDIIRFVNFNDALLRGDFNLYLQELAKNVELYNPSVIIFDPMESLRMLVHNENDYKLFIHKLFCYLHGIPCISILLGSSAHIKEDSVENYMVDGIFEFSYPYIGGVRKRYIEIMKLRGSNNEKGLIEFEILKSGFSII